MKSRCFEAIAKYLKLTPTEDEHTIKNRLKEALEQHKDDAEADPVRESEERTKKELADVKSELEAKMAGLTARQTEMSKKLDAILEKLKTL